MIRYRVYEPERRKQLHLEGQRHHPLHDSKSAEIRERIVRFVDANSGA